DIQGQATERGSGVELLSDGDESGPVTIKHVHDPAEVEQGSGQPIDFINHHAVHFTHGNVDQQKLQGRAVHVGAGEAAVVVELFHCNPAFVLLAADKGL